jgi:hypothetical protein
MSDQWVIVEPGVIVLPTTGYEIRRTNKGAYQAYHEGRPLGSATTALDYLKTCTVGWHMRDLIAVGVEP